MVLGHNINLGKRTKDIQITEDVTFDTMLLTENTLKGLKDAGFYKPSPVQLHGVPLGKCGFDLLLEAKSGTGKTAVFTLIALEKLDLAINVQAVILAPTREIAAQVCDVIKQIGSHFNGLRVEVVMGGLPVQEDIHKFKKQVHIVVGSPGRLRHLIHAHHIDISSVRLLVLDEADKLMEKSYLRDINYIFSVLPQEKQVIMSSATYPESSKEFIKKYVRNAQHICPDNNIVLLGVTQNVSLVKSNCSIVRQTQHRYEELTKILSQVQFKQCLIFCNYQARVIELCKMLSRDNWPVELIYGQQEQSERLDAIKTLQEYKCRILLATDLVARGIDAPNVDLVINFESPFEWQTYLHRIGRAGRFGSYGTAITILSEGKEQNQFQAMVSAIKLPLNLKRMWTEELFLDENFHVPSGENKEIIKQPITTVPNKCINKQSSDQLWRALIDEHDTTETLQSFDKLLISFEEVLDPKIDSFNNNQQNTEEGNKYIHLQFPPENVNDNNLAYIHHLKCIEKSEVNQTNEMSSCTPEFKNEDVEYHDCDGVGDRMTNNLNCDILKSCEENKTDNEVLHQKIFNSKSTPYQYQNSVKKPNTENRFFNVQQTKNCLKTDDSLSNYPTAFYSSKNKGSTRNQYKADVKRDNWRAKNVCDTRLNETDIINSHLRAEKRLCDTNRSKHLNQNQGSNTKLEYSARNITKKKNNHVSNFSNMRVIKTECTESTLRNNYIAWYNQLKAQMCQIESAVYFNEISRLYQ